MLLEVRGLGKDYGAHRAVDDVSFSVAAGEIFGLLGPNGAGKTTTISMLSGVLEASRGDAVVAGFDIQKEGHQAKRRLGLVPQELAVYEAISSVENLRFFGALHGLKGKTLLERIEWALELAGLSSRASEPVSRFSGGMKRRLNLVCGLVHRPELLVLDEPTVGVDPQSRNFIFRALKELCESGMAILYTSHYMQEVEELCERVAIMDGGRVLALDRVEELVATHGTQKLEIAFEGDDDKVLSALAPFGAELAAAGTIELEATDSLAAVFTALETAGAKAQRVSTATANLETVFLALTGHSLRDGDT